ncbi:MAG: sugar ABC transporter substrate-binding protein [Spirochaetaceae bacterium]|jgi:ribose transport system substrate-binding protein|nr:sugar ABC transporter substrate-binding protein [Spirochaetaceae bacterium]
MKKRIGIMVLIALTACGSLFAGGGRDGGAKTGKRVFGYTYWAASDFFETIGQSMREIIEANGDEIIIVDAQQDNQYQLNVIEDFITRGVSVVFLNPVDRDAIRPALVALQNAKIPVVNLDTSVADLSMVASYIASDNVGAGVICAEALNKALPGGGDIAILDYPANSACLDRTEGFKKTINSNFRIVAQQDAQGKPGPGLEKATDILTANPNLKAIFAANDQSGMGAFGAVVEANANVLVYGVDGAPESKEVISQGTQYAGTAAQSPKQIGTKGAEVAYNILNGRSYEKEFYVPTFLIDINNAKDYLGFWQ